MMGVTTELATGLNPKLYPSCLMPGYRLMRSDKLNMLYGGLGFASKLEFDEYWWGCWYFVFWGW